MAWGRTARGGLWAWAEWEEWEAWAAGVAWEAGVVWGEVSAGEMRDFGERSEGRSGGVRGLHGSLALRLKDVCQWKDPG